MPLCCVRSGALVARVRESPALELAKWPWHVLSVGFAAALLAAPAHAESSGAASVSAAARLDFRVTVPRLLYLRVGSGTNTFKRVATVNRISFSVPAAQVGNGVPRAALASSGDLTGGAVTVRVFANHGNSVTLNSRTTGPLKSATGDNIGWNEIVAASGALVITTAGYSNGTVGHPAFNTGASGGNGAAVTLTGTSKVVRAEGKWTFSYANSDPVAAGDYGRTVARNGRVTYTAAQP